MPLTQFQKKLARLLAANRSPESHLAGGAALHFSPNSRRYSNDLDYFHDSEKLVGEAFAADRATIRSAGLETEVEMTQPGYVRAVVRKGKDSTKVEWAHDSAWRFMPAVRDPEVGYTLHPVDLALNKVLTLAGRDEARDFLDVVTVHEELLSLGALLWAAVGKDAGFTPLSLLELVRRRGQYRPEDFAPLRLAVPIDLTAMKETWLGALEDAAAFVRGRPAAEAGCLYFSASKRRFVTPAPGAPADAAVHFGRPGGVLPRLYSSDSL